jgi:periplasmic protein CpxP/Spy
MNRVKHFAPMAAAVALAFAGVAPALAADPPAAPPPGAEAGPHGHHGHWGRGDPAKRAEFFKKRMDELHGKLKLSKAQEGAWGAFLDQSKPPAPPPRPDREQFAALKTPERLDKMLEMQRAHLDRQAERAAAVKRFYSQLNPSQQKVFDDSFQPPHRRGGPPDGQPG